MITDSQARALRALRENPGLTPRKFARHMWPDSPCWEHYTKCGPNGVTCGGGMNLAAGGYLGKLDKLGYVESPYRRSSSPKFYLTKEGRKALREYEEAHS